MFTSLTLASMLLVTLAVCSFNVELNNGEEITFSRNEVSGVSSLASGVVCGSPNRLTENVRLNLEKTFKKFRLSLNSSAMYNTKWSKTLAKYAQGKSDQCDMGFNFTNSCHAIYYTSMGDYSHNKEMESNPIASFLRSMYEQKNLYQVYNSSCTQKGGCKLFKFLARDTLAEFGCAVTKCDVLTMSDGSVLNNKLRTVCYYAHGLALNHVPTWRHVKDRPYDIEGAVCSRCDDMIKGGFTCINGLCEDKCTTGSCVCKNPLKCSNGNFNKETCVCECNKGFFGNECEYPCKCIDTAKNCQFSSQRCGNPIWFTYTRTYCSATCPNVCERIKPSSEKKSCQE